MAILKIKCTNYKMIIMKILNYNNQKCKDQIHGKAIYLKQN